MSSDEKDLTKRYTLGEEIFNSVSHGVGVFFCCGRLCGAYCTQCDIC